MLITLRGSRVNSKQTNGRGGAKHKGGLGQIVQRMAFFTRPKRFFTSLLLWCWLPPCLILLHECLEEVIKRVICNR